MNLDVITRREDLDDSIQREWDELAALDRRDGFFRTPAWYCGWITWIRPDARPFVVVVRNSLGRLIGLAPLCRLKYNDLGFQLTALAWGGREVVSGDFLDFLAEPSLRQAVTGAILDFLWERRSDWAMLALGELIESGESERAVESLARRHDLALRRQEPRLCPYIALPATFDEYLNGLSSATRYHIRRRIRDVEKKGARVEVYSDPASVAEQLDTMIRLHLARWQRDDQPGTFSRAGFPEFLKQICAHPPAGASSRLYMLIHENAPAAALLTFFYGESALYYQAGWDPASPLAGLSPGVVVMARSIGDAIESGCRYYEFLRGDEEYKSRWTKQARTTSATLAGRSLMARHYLRLAGLKDTVKQHLLAKPQPQQERGTNVAI